MAELALHDHCRTELTKVAQCNLVMLSVTGQELIPGRQRCAILTIIE